MTLHNVLDLKHTAHLNELFQQWSIFVRCFLSEQNALLQLPSIVWPQYSAFPFKEPITTANKTVRNVIVTPVQE